MTDEEVFELLPVAASLVLAVRERDAVKVAECLNQGRPEALAVLLAGMHWDLASARNEALTEAGRAQGSERAAYVSLRAARERMKGLERDLDGAAERFREKKERSPRDC